MNIIVDSTSSCFTGRIKCSFPQFPSTRDRACLLFQTNFSLALSGANGSNSYAERKLPLREVEAAAPASHDCFAELWPSGTGDLNGLWRIALSGWCASGAKGPFLWTVTKIHGEHSGLHRRLFKPHRLSGKPAFPHFGTLVARHRSRFPTFTYYQKGPQFPTFKVGRPFSIFSLNRRTEISQNHMTAVGELLYEDILHCMHYWQGCWDSHVRTWTSQGGLIHSEKKTAANP